MSSYHVQHSGSLTSSSVALAIFGYIRKLPLDKRDEIAQQMGLQRGATIKEIILALANSKNSQVVQDFLRSIKNGMV